MQLQAVVFTWRGYTVTIRGSVAEISKSGLTNHTRGANGFEAIGKAYKWIEEMENTKSEFGQLCNRISDYIDKLKTSDYSDDVRALVLKGFLNKLTGATDAIMQLSETSDAEFEDMEVADAP